MSFEYQAGYKVKVNPVYDRHLSFLPDVFILFLQHPLKPMNWCQWIVDHDNLWDKLVEHKGSEEAILEYKKEGIFDDGILYVFMENCGLIENGFAGCVDRSVPYLRPGYNWEAQSLIDFISWYQNKFLVLGEPKKRGWPKGKPRKPKTEQEADGEPE